MSRIPYNGFTPEERGKAAAWLYANVAIVDRCCDGCGNPKARRHSEDYSYPYGPHVGAYSLCQRCHHAVHIRHRNPANWERLKTQARGVVGDRRTVFDDIEEKCSFPSRRSIGSAKILSRQWPIPDSRQHNGQRGKKHA